MDQSFLCSVKYMEHVTKVKKTSKPMKSGAGQRKNPVVPKTVRISVTDPDATDSCSDEKDDIFGLGRRRVKRYISEVRIEAEARVSTVTSSAADTKKKAVVGDSLHPKARSMKVKEPTPPPTVAGMKKFSGPGENGRRKSEILPGEKG